MTHIVHKFASYDWSWKGVLHGCLSNASSQSDLHGAGGLQVSYSLFVKKYSECNLASHRRASGICDHVDTYAGSHRAASVHGCLPYEAWRIKVCQTSLLIVRNFADTTFTLQDLEPRGFQVHTRTALLRVVLPDAPLFSGIRARRNTMGIQWVCATTHAWK